MIENWDEIRLPWYEKTRYTPEIESGFEGVAIWTPDSVSLGRSSGRIAVFGVVRLGEEAMRELSIEDRHPARAVVVGATLEGVNAPFVGNAVLQAPLFEVEPGPYATEYFAVDLVECAGVPPDGGTRLFVFASVGPLVAAPRKVEVLP